MHREDHGHTSIIFQRLKAQESLNDLQRQRARTRFAGNVRSVWAERTFLLRVAAIGLVLGLLIAFLVPPRYNSTVRLMPPDNQALSSLAIAEASLSLHGAGGIGQIAGDLLGLHSTSDVFVGILNSRTLQDKIIEQFDLKQVYGTKRMDSTRTTLSSRVNVAVDRKTDMVTITVTDRSPERAANIANAYVDQLNRLVAELSTSSARRERVFLETFLGQVKHDLDGAEKDFSQFASKNNTIDIGEQGRALVGAAAALQGQLMAAQSELEATRQIYSDSNIRVRTAKARIEELQSQLRKLAGSQPTGAVGPETSAGELYPSIRKLPLLGVTYADLYRRAKVQESIYDVLTQEYDLAKVQEARDLPTVKVLDAANIPETKSFPPRLAIISCSMFLTSTAGLLIVLGSKSWNERDPDDLGKAVATEIWIDLKATRLLTILASQQRSASNLSLRRRGILSFLGLNARNDDRSCSSAD